ncbi:hypothetical protein F4808DRAFT_443265 [Astrocystis sublimbata]|nr:hypothetical protein F4808DRAFT_443265 [Astrocystis sublimbata]
MTMEQQPGADDKLKADEDFQSALAALPPVQEWTLESIQSLKSAIETIYPEVWWVGKSDWTRRLIDAILAPHEGWNRKRLRYCSNAEYFSLPLHTIFLLNALAHDNELDVVKEELDKRGGPFDPIDLKSQLHVESAGCPIYRVDYASDQLFALYKTCWDMFLERKYYVCGEINRDDVSWHWIDNRDKLDGKGPCEVRTLHQDFAATTFPPGFGLEDVWVCLMADRESIQSMLRVYGPPAKEVECRSSMPRS